ncbi:hypothetical protein VTJ04DRAFT_4373 [Mycothermus thermophilus]|uniref:uncharacterized protein n=1 Tax=Humicola insolens TaxID=85995 RepID=UPI003743C4F7
MRFSLLALVALKAASVMALDPPSEVPTDPTEALQELESLTESAYLEITSALQEAENKRRIKRSSSCTLSKLRIRREWGTLSTSQKKAYINAVKCLQSKTANTPSSLAPGAKTRFDDFVATHINQTLTIHYTGNFHAWHRYYVWIYETALRTECGYTGAQPYWDWAKSAITGLHNSPVFDGSDTSFSGDGEFIPDKPNLELGGGLGLPPLILPAGTGGGCVTSGPFKDMVVNLGPVSLDLPGGLVGANPDGPLAWNPRCLKRDLTDWINQRFANATSVLRNILLPTTTAQFNDMMEGVPGSGEMGLHGGGHYSMGGDPGRDVFVSPGDPAFYLHHAAVDRVWYLWQLLNPLTRMQGSSAIAGTRTMMNMPPSDPATIEDYVDLGFAGGVPTKIKDLLVTTGGPLCYVYL